MSSADCQARKLGEGEKDREFSSKAGAVLLQGKWVKLRPLHERWEAQRIGGSVRAAGTQSSASTTAE